MPTRKFFLCTWNCENQTPGDPSPSKLNSIIDLNYAASVIAQTKPDVVCFAMQELSSGAKFVTALTTKLGSDYVVVADGGMRGRTKGPVCYTYIVVLVKLAELQWVGEADTENVCNFAGKKKWKVFDKKPTKGAAIVRMQYGGLLMAFGGSHLDASSTKERLTHVNSITNSMKQGGDDPALAFFMGDLNYRLRRPNDNMALKTFVDLILDPAKRWHLYGLDSFQKQDFTGWTFPIPRYQYPDGPLIFPTYKREYKKRGGQNPCVQMLMAMQQGGSYRGRSAEELCALCYKLAKKQKRKKKWLGLKKSKSIDDQMGKDTKVSKKGRKVAVPEDRYFHGDPFHPLTYGTGQWLEKDDMVDAYEMGWLDRIGYKKDESILLDVQEYQDLPWVTLSDHAPVYMVAEVTWRTKSQQRQRQAMQDAVINPEVPQYGGRKHAFV